jgi:hypothetical protein
MSQKQNKPFRLKPAALTDLENIWSFTAIRWSADEYPRLSVRERYVGTTRYRARVAFVEHRHLPIERDRAEHHPAGAEEPCGRMLAAPDALTAPAFLHVRLR